MCTCNQPKHQNKKWKQKFAWFYYVCNFWLKVVNSEITYRKITQYKHVYLGIKTQNTCIKNKKKQLLMYISSYSLNITCKDWKTKMFVLTGWSGWSGKKNTGSGRNSGIWKSWLYSSGPTESRHRWKGKTNSMTWLLEV